ncbi:MAG: GDSL-type esterase/lipase family protein [Saprospiraceae bacterium]
MIGDSTMANKKDIDYPETGWGQVFHEYFTDAVEIHNYAVNGRSTKSFRDRGHWQEVYDQLQKNDYVIIQFGHNDSKEDDPARYAAPHTDYKDNLIRYIDEIRSKGAIPILATPIYRRKFDDNGTLLDAHGDYPGVVREVAAAKHVDLLDMHKLSGEFIQKQGKELSKYMFMNVQKKVYPKFPDGVTDNTHLTPSGARDIASLAAQELITLHHPLRNFLKKSEFEGKYKYELPNIATTGFPKDTYNIIDYGANPSANFLNTNAIQTAIDMANKNDGGVVIIPNGLWVTGPIQLKSNVNLFIDEGALLQFSDNRDDYPIVSTTWEGQSAYRCQAPISASNCSNIAITGKGMIDGSGQVWKSVKRNKLSDSEWKRLIKSGGVHDDETWYPSESSRIGHNSDWAKKITEGKTMEDYSKVKDFLRPNMISFISCNLILIDGVTLMNSPAWIIHPLMCNHVIVKDVNVTNPWYGQNNDAIDLESCNYGILDGCHFDTGDDAITLKSGRDEEGRKRGMPTQNIIISNTKVPWTRWIRNRF